MTATAWLLVLGYAGHGLKDFWQERRHYVANTRWWPPFCATVDWLVAVILVVEIVGRRRLLPLTIGLARVPPPGPRVIPFRRVPYTP